MKENDILLIIKNLNMNKAQRGDNVSIRMIQLCGKSIAKPLKYLFVSSLTAGTFTEDWKKGNIIPVHKKSSKNCLKSYRPIIYQQNIFSKIFDRLIFNALFNFFCSKSVVYRLSIRFNSREFLCFAITIYNPRNSQVIQL